jgi:hypothetical protein
LTSAVLQHVVPQATASPGQPLSEQQSHVQSVHEHEPVSQQLQHGHDPQPALESRPIPTGTADVRVRADNNKNVFM